MKEISDALLAVVTPTVIEAESTGKSTKAIEAYLEINGLTMAEYRDAIAVRSKKADAANFWNDSLAMAGNVAEA